MTATAKIDRVSMLECSLKFGIVERVVRRVFVSGLTDTDYEVLISALEAAGVPQAGATLPDSPKFRNLVLKEHAIRVVQDDPSMAEVDCTYGLIEDEGQSIDAPPYGILVGKLTTTLTQVSTNKDRDGNILSTSYTYPADADPSVAGQTITQGGNAQYQRPQKSLSYEGIKQTQFPWLIANAIVGKVNSGPFAGGQENQWLCTSCDWRVADGTDPNRYYFTFTFEFSDDDNGWQPTVLFRDPFTGLPPPDYVPGTGSVEAKVYNEISFEQIMGTRVQGG